MPRTIFITEGASPLGSALIRLLVARGCTVATTRDAAPEGAEEAAPSAGRSIVTVPWRRRSPVSARAAFLSVVNALDAVDAALLLEPPGGDGGRPPVPLGQTQSSDIERAFDEARGPVFMAREVLAFFARAGGGVLCMVGGTGASGPLAAGVHECFRGVASALMAEPGGTGIAVNGFQSEGVGVEEYAAFIDRSLEEKARALSGRWFSCPARGGFLQGILRTSSTP
jgi:NAD(P)-dependent dehydrogenase (short-subunit alcohol dehydrogenase family)